jgi:hypothetical protein
MQANVHPTHRLARAAAPAVSRLSRRSAPRAAGGLHDEHDAEQPQTDSGPARVPRASACYTGPIAFDDLSIGRPTQLDGS